MRVFIWLSIAWLLPLANWAQCVTCPSSCITSTGTGNWDDCSIWLGVSCFGWPTATIMGNRNQVIQNGHTITVPSTASTAYHANTNGIYVQSGGTLTVNKAGWNTDATSECTRIVVSGTLNFNVSGTADFSAAELIVCSGGVVNIQAGTLRVDQIEVRNGGTLNLSGGTLSRDQAVIGFEIQAGGLMNITSVSSQLGDHSLFGTLTSTVDGTINCNNVLSSVNYTNFRLGMTRVTNGTSTGRIRTQTAYLPSSDVAVPPNVANNFFGYNSDYGGTVEFYGLGNITLDNLNSRYYFYSLEVNCPLLNLARQTFVRGMLDLQAGNLRLNGQRLNLMGGIQYVGSVHIIGGSNSRLHLLGKLSTDNSFESPGMTTFSISHEGSTVDIRNPQLRLSSFAGGPATLDTLRIFREDVVRANYSNLSINMCLNLQRGVLRTDAPNHLHITNTSPSSVLHYTTNWTILSGWVAGYLRRSVAASGTYDFPVGYSVPATYPASTSYSTFVDRHRRLTLDVTTQTGLTHLTTRFVPPTSSCAGSLPVITEAGGDYTQIHPEGHWEVTPNTTSYTIDYAGRLYVHGFNSPALEDDQFGPLKRITGGTCADWGTDGGTLAAAGGPGRLRGPFSGSYWGYAERTGWSSFSDLAIGIITPPVPLATNSWGSLSGYPTTIGTGATAVELTWQHTIRAPDGTYSIERQQPSGEFQRIGEIWADPGFCEGGCVVQSTFTDTTPASGRNLYRVRYFDVSGTVDESPIAEVWLPQPENAAGAGGWQLAPNPARQYVQVNLFTPLYGTTSVELLDSYGRTVVTHTTDAAESSMLQLPLAEVAAGLYTVRLRNHGQVLGQHRLLVSP